MCMHKISIAEKSEHRTRYLTESRSKISWFDCDNICVITLVFGSFFYQLRRNTTTRSSINSQHGLRASQFPHCL